MSDDDRYTRITLRIPKELVGSLKEAADARSHSMNAEIVQRLEDSFSDASLLEIPDLPITVRELGDFAAFELTMARQTAASSKEISEKIRSNPDASEIEVALADYHARKDEAVLRMLLRARSLAS